MIDCHVHTQRSHHGEGDLEDFVKEALDKNIKVLGFIEHAPLSFDFEHRLSLGETHQYLRDVDRIKKKYSDKIKILAGLEVDYVPSELGKTKKMLSEVAPDYVFGAVHFIETKECRISLWDYDLLQEDTIWQKYFCLLNDAVTCGLFDSLVHPDLILKSGLDPQKLLPYFEKHIKLSIKSNVCYEINCSGYSKPVYDPKRQIMFDRIPAYINFDAIKFGIKRGMHFTIGSDAHTVQYLSQNILQVVDTLSGSGLKEITYFEKRHPKKFHLQGKISLGPLG